jgi:hypothetical protein
MWTVVIPTIWKSNILIELLNSLELCNEVSQIILIDNNTEKQDLGKHKFYKLNVIEQEKNIYVNPAWNLGCSMSENENICICNDDVLFETHLFQHIEKVLTPKQVIGCHPKNFVEKKIDFQLNDGHFIAEGWGCVFFLKKSTFVEIPNEIKIWCGDDWLACKIKSVKNFTFPVKTKMSVSSSIPYLNKIAIEDKRLFKKYVSSLDLKIIELQHAKNQNNIFKKIKISLIRILQWRARN